MIYKFFRFFLFLFDPEIIHTIALFFLSLRPIQWFLSFICQFEDKRLEKKICGLRFKNPIGLAAGFDKNGVAVLGFQALGFGFVEVGTVTPKPQFGNPKPRIRRFVGEQALVNWLGFNNDGVEAVVGRVQKVRDKIKIPIGLNIGKGKETPLDKAIDDYLFCLEKGYPVFDFFVVNISSPNTLGLRNLQMGQYLEPLLRNLRKKSQELSEAVKKCHPEPSVCHPEPKAKDLFVGDSSRPLFVKVSPDLTGEELKETISLCEKYKISGIVATNTAPVRSGDYRLLRTADIEMGGISGRPLKEKAASLLENIHAMKTGMVLIGVGGILTPQDAKERFEVGSDLIEIYTGLIFSGPFFVRRIKKYLLTEKNDLF